MLATYLLAGFLSAATPGLANQPLMAPAMKMAGASARCLGPLGLEPSTLQIEEIQTRPAVPERAPGTGDCALA